MRIFLALLVVLAVVGGYVSHKHDQEAATHASLTQDRAAAEKETAHYWPKRTLDRVNEVKRQVAEQRKANELN